MSVVEFAEKFIKAQDEAIFDNNLSALLDLEDPDVVYHMSQGVDMVGWDGHKQLISGIRDSVTNFHHEWKYLAGEGHIFALSRKASGKIIGEIPGYKMPIGKEYIADSIMVFRLEKGKIVEGWENGSIAII
jgi:ketosteroid isomerase-like protein